MITFGVVTLLECPPRDHLVEACTTKSELVTQNNEAEYNI
jgi:hypothetical protein